MATKGKDARKRATDGKPIKSHQGNLDEVDREMLRRIVAQPSIKNKELREALGYKDIKAMSIRRARPIFQAELKRIQDELSKDAIQIAKETQSEAMRKVAQVMRLDLKDYAFHALSAAKFIARGIPEIASGLIRPQHDDLEDLTRAELEGTAEFALEVAKRKASNQG